MVRFCGRREGTRAGSAARPAGLPLRRSAAVGVSNRAEVQPGATFRLQRHVSGLNQSRGARNHYPRHEPVGRPAQRVTQQKADNDSLLPMLAEVQQQCGAPPQTVLADAGYYKNANLRQLEAEKIDAYIPDSNMAAALNRGRRVRGQARAGEMKRMRAKLRSPQGRKLYAQRKALVEGPFGTLKSERDLHRFRLCGLQKVGIEFTLGAIGYNLTRWHAERDPHSAIWCRRRARERRRNPRQTNNHKARTCRNT